jgi:hypothetical protein
MGPQRTKGKEEEERGGGRKWKGQEVVDEGRKGRGKTKVEEEWDRDECFYKRREEEKVQNQQDETQTIDVDKQSGNHQRVLKS